MCEKTPCELKIQMFFSAGVSQGGKVLKICEEGSFHRVKTRVKTCVKLYSQVFFFHFFLSQPFSQVQNFFVWTKFSPWQKSSSDLHMQLLDMRYRANLVPHYTIIFTIWHPKHICRIAVTWLTVVVWSGTQFNHKAFRKFCKVKKSPSQLCFSTVSPYCNI